MCIACSALSSRLRRKALHEGSHSPKDIMKKFVFLLIAAAALTSAGAGTSVGVSIDINQPGVYGRINIGNVAPPMVVYPQPVIIAPAPMALQTAPIYLYVPLQHQRHWVKYCARYQACGQRVFFVQEKWVKERYQQHQRDVERDRREHRQTEHSDRDHHDQRDHRDHSDVRL